MKSYIKILVLLLLTCSLFLSCSTKGYSRNQGISNLPLSSGFTAYKIQRGDSLLKIGNKFGVDPNVISITNNIYNPKNLRVGMWLRIPNSSTNNLSANYFKEEPNQQFENDAIRNSLLSPSELSSNKFARGRLSSTKPKVIKKKQAPIGWPIRTGKYTSGFGYRGKKFHHGIDISAKRGTPIFSAHDGVVAYSGSGLRGFGKTIIVKGEKGLYTLYAHANKLYVKKGQRVTRGKKIASVGSTGRSSGSHLHFEVRTKDNLGRYVVVDPVPLLDRYAKKKPRFKLNSKLNDILARADSHNHNF